MSEIHYINIGLLLWGCVFCILAALSLAMRKNERKEQNRWMLWMQISTAVLLGNDTLAWIFRGHAGTLGYYMVRISNFFVFLMTDVTLLFFHQYICSCLFESKKQKELKRYYIGNFLCVLAILLVLISQATNLYYQFDAENYYHRNPGFVISLLLPFCGMLLDLSLLLQYRRRVARENFWSMISYIILPVLMAAIQAFYYGDSLINVAIAVSMLLMFLTEIREQENELERLARSKEKTEEKFEIATTLNQCVAELSSSQEINLAIYKLLGIINHYFQADRTYVFEYNHQKEIVINTHEYVRDQVTEQKDNLQEVPVSIIAEWMDQFQKEQIYYLPDVEQRKDAAFYEALKVQDVYRLIAAPLVQKQEIIGFLGVDNPRSHYEDATLLSSIQFFVTNSLERKKTQDYLKKLSYHDSLTGIFNRNKYIEVLDGLQKTTIQKMGAAYMDLNGLKRVNDNQGHEVGDQLICRAAYAAEGIFQEQVYRIGGDEFVILCPRMDRELFEAKIKKLRMEMERVQVSVSIGSIWKEETENPEEMLKEADALMYQEKEAYHRRSGDFRG